MAFHETIRSLIQGLARPARDGTTFLAAGDVEAAEKTLPILVEHAPETFRKRARRVVSGDNSKKPDVRHQAACRVFTLHRNEIEHGVEYGHWKDWHAEVAAKYKLPSSFTPEALRRAVGRLKPKPPKPGQP